jgi:hypothetical protein
MLVIGTCNEASFRPLQCVLTGIGAELETPIFGGEQRLDVLTISGISDGHASPSQRMSVGCTHDCSGNPEISIRHRHLIRAGTPRAEHRRRARQRQHGCQNLERRQLSEAGHLFARDQLQPQIFLLVRHHADNLSFLIVGPHCFRIPVLQLGGWALEGKQAIDAG